jgi:hypothetical protein
VSLSLVADILDRLSGVSALKERIIQQDRVLEQMQRIMLDQQRDLAEMKGMIKAMVSMQSASPPRLAAERKPARSTPKPE